MAIYTSRLSRKVQAHGGTWPSMHRKRRLEQQNLVDAHGGSPMGAHLCL
jgi:hypothetical protein